jgi:hypothetical protein
MAVIYCNSCDLGIHYIDKCRGGKNGIPRMSAKQDRFWTIIENSIWIGFAIGLILAFGSMAYMLIRLTLN